MGQVHQSLDPCPMTPGPGILLHYTDPKEEGGRRTEIKVKVKKGKGKGIRAATYMCSAILSSLALASSLIRSMACSWLAKIVALLVSLTFFAY